jgi:ribonucleoside-diphosphate reductase beta chain
LVGNILLGFAQTECAVSDYWTNMVTKWFPKHEIKQMAMMFGSQETIHATAYSYLNETLGLEDFAAFLHEPATLLKNLNF